MEKQYVDMYMSHCLFGGRSFDSEKTCMCMPHCLVVSVLNQFRCEPLKKSRGHLVRCLCQENTGCLLFLLLFGFIMFQKKFYRQPVEMLPKENRGTYVFIKKNTGNQVIKHTQECEAGLVYRTTSAFVRTRHHVPTGFFSGLPELPRRLGTNVSDFVAFQVQLCHCFVHLEGLSDGLRLRRSTGAECQGGPGLGEWDAPAPVVGEPKVTPELVDVDYSQDSFKF